MYYPKDLPSNAKRGTIAVKKDIYDQFVFAFPGMSDTSATVNKKGLFRKQRGEKNVTLRPPSMFAESVLLCAENMRGERAKKQ